MQETTWIQTIPYNSGEEKRTKPIECLIIPPRTTISGDISTTASIDHKGTIEGDAISKGQITLDDLALVKGNVTAVIVEVKAGNVLGDINAKTHAYIGENACIKGDVNAALVIVKGVIEGSIHAEAVHTHESAIVLGKTNTQNIKVVE